MPSGCCYGYVFTINFLSKRYKQSCVSFLLTNKHSLLPCQIHSRALADAISNSLRGVLEPEFISFMQSFLYPVDYMIQIAEYPPPLNENAPRLRFTDDHQFVPLQGEGERTDPIFELFNSVHKPKPGNIVKLYGILLKNK